MMNDKLIGHFKPLREMATAIHELAKSKGWYDEKRTEKQFLTDATNNLHGEVSELWEALREGRLHNPCDKSDKMEEAGLPVLSCLEEELADVVIRALDDAQYLGVDIAFAVAAKHAFNATREHRHGGKAA